MADIPSHLETATVTTGPLPASRKIHVAGRVHPEIRVPLREIALEASANEPPVRVYDTPAPTPTRTPISTSTPASPSFAPAGSKPGATWNAMKAGR